MDSVTFRPTLLKSKKGSSVVSTAWRPRDESDLCDLDPILVFKLVKVRFATVTRHGTKQLREMRRRLQRKFVQPDSLGLTPS
ncbi:hypothetical protein [Neorhizobium galegae]|nr:hypothetical protein [Neorhizobium galegae]